MKIRQSVNLNQGCMCRVCPCRSEALVIHSTKRRSYIEISKKSPSGSFFTEKLRISEYWSSFDWMLFKLIPLLLDRKYGFSPFTFARSHCLTKNPRNLPLYRVALVSAAKPNRAFRRCDISAELELSGKKILSPALNFIDG